MTKQNLVFLDRRAKFVQKETFFCISRQLISHYIVKKPHYIWHTCYFFSICMSSYNSLKVWKTVTVHSSEISGLCWKIFEKLLIDDFFHYGKTCICMYIFTRNIGNKNLFDLWMIEIIEKFLDKTRLHLI